jgi:glycosyltransferase involved in cell wall biosynthesis
MTSGIDPQRNASTGALVDLADELHVRTIEEWAEKTQFLGDAAALLVPVDWPEPFGLVMIEAMACGTVSRC